MKNEILLSIICCAYNAEKGIRRTLDSVESQEYNNYELIMVNDGSTDKTLDIIKEYAHKYNNIVIIDKENSGLADSRNAGLKAAKGKYITFADADDYYKDNFFKVIVPELQKGNFDLLVFNADVINFGKCTNQLIPSKYKETSLTIQDGVKKYLQGEFCYRIGNVAWNKIYVRDIIEKNKLKHKKEKTKGQDLLFNILYASKAKRYKYIGSSLYCYELNINPITTPIYRPYESEENIKFYEPIKEICLENNIQDYEHYIGLFFLRRFFGVVLNQTNNDDYLMGKENIHNYLFKKGMNDVLKKVRFRNLDIKLFICYMLYKFKLYKTFYYILWHRRHK